MMNEEKQKSDQFKYQPSKEQKGYQPLDSRPQNNDGEKDTVESNGNIAQKQ